MGQEETLDDIAKRYREEGRETDFLEIRRRLRPLIRKRSSGLRFLLSADDIDQTAALAIATALLRFDPSKGSFAAYAVPFIVGYLRAQVAAVQVVKRPDGETERMLVRAGRARRFIEGELAQGRSNAQAVAAAAAHFGVELRVIEGALAGVSLTRENAEERAGDMHDAGLMTRQQRGVIERALSTLEPHEQRIVEFRFREEPASLKDTGEAVGVDWTNISKITRRSLARMRAALEAQGICAEDVLA